MGWIWSKQSNIIAQGKGARWNVINAMRVLIELNLQQGVPGRIQDFENGGLGNC